MYGKVLLLLFALSGSRCDDDFDDGDDSQTEFYLPYSETEDVDFSLSRPSGVGCYQW